MALAFQLQAAGFTPDELTTEAAVSLVPDGPGFKIDKSHLTLRAAIPGIDRARFDELAGAAEKGCPVSRLMNAEITLDAALT
jgi:osmotically inducible protein OsmC